MRQIESIKKLLSTLKPISLKIEDETMHHASHFTSKPDAEFPSHVKITITSDLFNNMSLIKRHRAVNSCLIEAFANGLHAAKIIARTPAEMDRLNKT